MLKGKDILNTAQFSLQELNLIMNTAANFERRVKNEEVIRNMEGKVVASLFFEPSTRTRLSFETAINRLGARVVTIASAASSSVAKGETLADTIRTIDGYVDVIVMRHPMKGAAQLAADNAFSTSSVSSISAPLLLRSSVIFAGIFKDFGETKIILFLHKAIK